MAKLTSIRLTYRCVTADEGAGQVRMDPSYPSTGESMLLTLPPASEWFFNAGNYYTVEITPVETAKPKAAAQPKPKPAAKPAAKDEAWRGTFVGKKAS